MIVRYRWASFKANGILSFHPSGAIAGRRLVSNRPGAQRAAVDQKVSLKTKPFPRSRRLSIGSFWTQQSAATSEEALREEPH
jgi:hypothetical protein